MCKFVMKVATTLAVVACVIGLATTSFAGLIQPDNWSFESPGITGGPWYQNAVPTFWSCTDPNMSYLRHSNYDSGVTGETGSQWEALVQHDTPLYQTISSSIATIQANTTYQFKTDLTAEPVSVPVGYDMTGCSMVMTLNAVSATNVVTQIATSTIAGSTINATAGAFTTYSTADTLPDQGLVGQRLQVKYTITGDGGGSICCAIDNVGIESTLVPEPSTLALVASGLIGLLCYAWRKRK